MKYALNTIFAVLVGWLYRLWCSTLRYTESGKERAHALVHSDKPVIFCMWHDELFGAIHRRADWPLVTIVSRSKDGEYLALLLKRLGIVPARGSSSRGGFAAARFTAKLISEHGYAGCITIDGPRGPRHEPKNGAIHIAHLVSGYIIPLRVFAKRAKIFNSWDRFQLPLPFSRVHLYFDEPYMVTASELTDEALERERAKLKQKLNAITPPERFYE